MLVDLLSHPHHGTDENLVQKEVKLCLKPTVQGSLGGYHQGTSAFPFVK